MSSVTILKIKKNRNRNEETRVRNKKNKTGKSEETKNKTEHNKETNIIKREYSNHNKEPKARKNTEEAKMNRNNSNNNGGRTRRSPGNIGINYMKVMYSNVDCLTNKKAELHDRIYSYNPHIIALTEVNPKNYRFAVTKNEMDIPGYALFTNAEQARSRGVAIYIINHLNPTESNCMAGLNVHEIVAAEIKLKGNDKQLIMCAYRSPNTSNPENETRINNIVRSTKDMGYSHVLLLGDFNHPDIKWDNGGTLHNANNVTNDFLDAVNDAYLYQHIEFPTRYRENETSNILDLVFTNEESMVEESKANTPLGSSDHAVITFRLICYADLQTHTRTRYLYDKANFTDFREYLNIDWDKLLNNQNTECKWQKIKEKIITGCELYVPKKTVKPMKRRPPWMNKGTLRSIRKKHKAWAKITHSPTAENYMEYKKTRNQARWETRKAMKNYEKEIASNMKNNPKLFWKYVNSKLKTRQPLSDLMKPDGTLTTSDEEKAEILNNFFSSVFTKEDIESIPELNTNRTISKLSNFDITEAQLTKYLQKLNPNKSPGPDGMHPRILKELATVIAKPLAMLFQTSLNEGSLPSDWKIGNISPIHKKGPKTDSGNYRPVCLTSIICKIMESFIRDNLLRHMKENNLLSEHQHGFLPGRSTITQLLEAMDYWTEALDSSVDVDIIYLDFQKAFDSVPHQRLLKKLESYNISGKIYKWIESFLLNRRQRVIVNNSFSSWADVISGIPQGSVLGPVLFTIFINDMPTETICPIKLFADDAKLYHKIESEEDCQKIQNDLNRLQAWAKKWQLRFHPHKCTVLSLGRNRYDYKYNMVSADELVTLHKPDFEKDLGVLIDRGLSFEDHINHIVKKANKLTGLMWRSFSYVDKKVLVTLYKSMIRPHLEYASSVWSPHTWKLAEEIEKIQRRATKRVATLRDHPYEQRLQSLCLPTLVYRRIRGDLINMYKYTNHLYDVKPVAREDPDDTRRGHSSKLHKTTCRRNRRLYFFSLRVINWWNKLPQEIIDAPSVNAFKNRLDKHFSAHPVMFNYRALDNPVKPEMTVS